MPDYSKGKIYKIYCNITGETYYGSTVNTLAKRMGTHRDEAKETSKTCTSKSIMSRGDYDYSLVENYNCNNKQELHARERYWIENNECVNKKIPGRTPKEWYEANKDKISEEKKVFYEANKDKISEQKKVFYETNKDKIKERSSEKIVCECGCELRRDSLTGHRKSKFHQDFIQSLGSGGNTI